MHIPGELADDLPCNRLSLFLQKSPHMDPDRDVRFIQKLWRHFTHDILRGYCGDRELVLSKILTHHSQLSRLSIQCPTLNNSTMFVWSGLMGRVSFCLASVLCTWCSCTHCAYTDNIHVHVVLPIWFLRINVDSMTGTGVNTENIHHLNTQHYHHTTPYPTYYTCTCTCCCLVCWGYIHVHVGFWVSFYCFLASVLYTCFPCIN